MRNQYVIEERDDFKVFTGLGIAAVMFVVAKSTSTFVLSSLIIKALMFSLMHCIAGGIYS